MQALSESQIKAKGYKISPESEPLPDGYEGPHPDWGYNVGETDGYEGLWAKKLDELKAPCKEPNAKGKFCKKDLYEVAKQEAIVDANKFKAWFEKPKGVFVIANLYPKYKKALGVDSPDVSMSTKMIIKNKEHHPEIEWFEYLLINSVINRSDLVLFRDGEILVHVKEFEKEYFCVVRATSDKTKATVASFRYTNASDIKNEKLRSEVLYER